MISAGVKEIKNNLSRYLLHVKQGEEIVITERGKPLARIVKENQGKRSMRAALSDLIDKGVLTLPTSRLDKKNLAPKEVPGRPVSEMIIEDRR
jgi:prevent-host-death family protein